MDLYHLRLHSRRATVLFSVANLTNLAFAFPGDQHGRDPVCCFQTGTSQEPAPEQEGDPSVLLPAVGTPQCPRAAEETWTHLFSRWPWATGWGVEGPMKELRCVVLCAAQCVLLAEHSCWGLWNKTPEIGLNTILFSCNLFGLKWSGHM